MARELQNILSSGEVTEVKIGGTQSEDAAAKIAELNAHTGDQSNPHQTDKTDVGLGNVDNTSDVNKPISNDTQAALDLKADITYVDSQDALKQNIADLTDDIDTHLGSGDVPAIRMSITPSLTDKEKTPTIQTLYDQKFSKWRGKWENQSYDTNDMVFDDGWLMIANKLTADRPAPQPVGEPFYLFDGTMADQTAAGVRQVVFGTRYASTQDFYLNGYRINVVAGNFYEIISVIDPLGVGQTRFLNAFTADVTGWRQFGLIPEVFPAGTTFDLIVIVNQPDPTPVTITGDWNYATPQNPLTPTTGQISQAVNQADSLRVHSRDNVGTDRTVELQSLEIGDRIVAPDIEWAIQGITENGISPDNWFNFLVAPARQSSGVGVKTFVFESTEAVDITYARDDGYYVGSAVASGLFVEDSSWENVVEDDNAYGADILVQSVYISPDWEVMANGSGGGGIADDVPGGVYAVAKLPAQQEIITVAPTFTDLISVSAPNAKSGIYEYKFSILFTLNSTSNSAIFEYSLDNTTWYRIRIEAKDTDDQRPLTYFFPIEYISDTPLNLYIRAAKEVGTNTMTVLFADAIIDQKD